MMDANKENRISIPIWKRMVQWLRRADYTPLLLCWAVAVFYWVTCDLNAKSFAGVSGYPTYTLQALAWKNGRIYLDTNYEWLELAFNHGHWYVSFPPVPSIPLFFLTFLFQEQTPENLLVKIYVLIGCLAIYHMLKKADYDRLSAVAFALFCSFAGCMLSLTSEGAVWYQAQTLAFCLTALSVAAMFCGKTTAALILYALAVGCRPFNAIYGAFLFTLYADDCRRKKQSLKKSSLRLVPGIAAGLLIAALYGIYNAVRFDNPFEFGHNYLPEFSWQGGKQFSLENLPENFRTFVLGLPFEEDLYGWEMNLFGFSFLAANPVFILYFIWNTVDLIRGKYSWLKGMLLFSFLLHLFFLLLHHTFGGFQFGARYTCDLLPYAAAYLALDGHKRKILIPEAILLIAACGFAYYGYTLILL